MSEKDSLRQTSHRSSSEAKAGTNREKFPEGKVVSKRTANPTTSNLDGE